MTGQRMRIALTMWVLATALAWGLSQSPPFRSPKSREPVNDLLERAKALAQKGDWEAARREFEKAVKANPDDVDARMGLTEALLQLGKWAETLPHLRWLSQKIPRNPRIWATLGQVQEQLKQLDEAIAALRKAVHLQPEEPEFRLPLARVLIAKERWDDAAHHLRWLAHRVPDLASVPYHLALYYERKGDIDKALHYARRTVRLSPREPEARLTFARLLVQKGDLQAAARQLETLLRQFPTSAELTAECAKLFAQGGDHKNAIRYFRRTLHLQPENADAHRALADLYRQRRQWTKALWHIRWLARRFPTDVEIVKAKAQTEEQLGRYEEAERTLQRWATLRPKDFEPFLHLARLYRERGDAAKARMAYDEALRRRPPTEVIAEAAELEERLGEWERAAKLYEWAQRRDPDNPQWRALRAEALLKAGQFERAGRILRFALKRFPDHPRLNTLMGLWHAKRVEWVEAEGFLKKGIGDGRTPDLHAVGALVEIWLCQGRVKEAVGLCERLLQTNPSAEVLIWWAQGMEAMGKTKEAAQRLEGSQAFAKGDERMVRAVARLWELAGEPSRAAAVWQNLAERRGDKRGKAWALLQAATVWERANNFPKALAMVEAARRWLPDEPSLAAERIRLMLNAQAFAAALDEAERFLKRFPTSPEAAQLYAEAAYHLWHETALERVSERVKKEPQLAKALLLLAERMNRRQEGETLLRQLLPHLRGDLRQQVERWLPFAPSPNSDERAKSPMPNPQTLVEQAQKAATEGRIGEALLLCRKAIAHRRDFLPAYEVLLHLYRQRNDLSHAIQGFTRLANRFRDDLPFNFAAATALSLGGQHRRAIAYWRRVCALTDNAPHAMVKLAESLEAIREDVQAQWVRNFVKRWEGLAHAVD
ncbi:MAG: hypothetical protein C4295_06120 [Candidatus Fervidibacterota bacterium]